MEYYNTLRVLTLKDNSLYIANSANNEILEYSLDLNTLDVFIRDFSDHMRPGGISFGPDQNLYVINEIDNNIYRYDVEKNGLIDIFTNFDTAETKFALDSNSHSLEKYYFLHMMEDIFLLVVLQPTNCLHMMLQLVN